MSEWRLVTVELSSRPSTGEFRGSRRSTALAALGFGSPVYGQPQVLPPALPRHLNEQQSALLRQLAPFWRQEHDGLDEQLESLQSTARSQSLSTPSLQFSAVGAPQSALQEQRSSAPLQVWSPQKGGGGGAPQSSAQFVLFSTPLQEPSPQHDGALTVVVQVRPLPVQRESEQPTAPEPPKPQQNRPDGLPP